MNNCPKCNYNDPVVTFIKDGGLITSSSFKRIDDEFVRSSEYSYYFKLTAKKDHLYKHCRECQYSWREKTSDSV